MDRLDTMAVFVAVADAHGFAAAARRLKLSPPVVTRSIASLEERLGTRLLQRTTRSVRLTDAGVRYLERARRILADVDEAEGAAQLERSEPSGRFVVAAPQVFGRLHVAPVMCTYLGLHAGVNTELILGDRMANLVDEGIDAAVRIGDLDDAGYVARNVGATRRVIVASPGYLAKAGMPRVPDDLADHTTIQFNALTPTTAWRFPGDLTVSIRPRYVTNSADAAIGHAERDGGLTQVLAYQVVDAVAAGRLCVVLSAYEPRPLPIQIVFPTSRLLSAKVRAFVELVTSTCTWRFIDLVSPAASA